MPAETPAELLRGSSLVGAEWLARQRWFGSKGREISAVTVIEEQELFDGDPGLRHLLLQVTFTDGLGSEVYQCLVGLREAIPEWLEPWVLGQVAGTTAYDAAHDPELMATLLELIAAGSTVGPLHFVRATDEPLDTGLRPRVMGAEQSNTSLVYGDEYILKLFRRIAPGINPDLELTRALAAAGSTHVAPPLGWIESDPDGEPLTLGLLQPFLRLASEGWALATTSVRDLYAEADLHADEVGGDFAAESTRLGQATAEVHADLARTMPVRVAGPEELADMASAMTDRLAVACTAVPELAAHREPLQAAFDALAGWQAPLPLQRIHGDYHLGQVLRTDAGWVLLDFEGEPARPLAERSALESPLRDVAGMLRSFDYAAQHLLADRPGQAHLAYRAVEWAERNREAFCDGYTEGSGRDPRESAVPLRAFELDKAVYEVVYEARNRPSWLPIPLGSIERLLSRQTPEGKDPAR